MKALVHVKHRLRPTILKPNNTEKNSTIRPVVCTNLPLSVCPLTASACLPVCVCVLCVLCDLTPAGGAETRASTQPASAQTDAVPGPAAAAASPGRGFGA